jgi:hypothetical protein
MYIGGSAEIAGKVGQLASLWKKPLVTLVVRSRRRQVRNASAGDLPPRTGEDFAQHRSSQVCVAAVSPPQPKRLPDIRDRANYGVGRLPLDRENNRRI